MCKPVVAISEKAWRRDARRAGARALGYCQRWSRTQVNVIVVRHRTDRVVSAAVAVALEVARHRQSLSLPRGDIRRHATFDGSPPESRPGPVLDLTVDQR